MKLWREDCCDSGEVRVRLPLYYLLKAGMSAGDMLQMFGEPVFAQKSEALAELSAQLRAAKVMMESSLKKTKTDDDVNFYLVVVFKHHDERVAFTTACGLEDNRFVDGRELQALLVKEGP